MHAVSFNGTVLKRAPRLGPVNRRAGSAPILTRRLITPAALPSEVQVELNVVTQTVGLVIAAASLIFQLGKLDEGQRALRVQLGELDEGQRALRVQLGDVAKGLEAKLNEVEKEVTSLKIDFSFFKGALSQVPQQPQQAPQQPQQAPLQPQQPQQVPPQPQQQPFKSKAAAREDDAQEDDRTP